MQINMIKLTIDNFGNQSMFDYPSHEVARILRELAAKVDDYGVVNAFDGTYLKDSNGNTIGLCDCDWSEDDD